MFWNFKKKPGSKLVMTFGTFDVLHAGHEDFFKQARAHGDEIITILARHETVKTIKGEDPVYTEKQRLQNLKKTGWTDHIVYGNRLDKHKVIIKYKPDIIALGYDQYAFTQRLEKTIIDANLNAEIVRLNPFYPRVHKSSIIKRKINVTKQNSQATLQPEQIN